MAKYYSIIRQPWGVWEQVIFGADDDDHARGLVASGDHANNPLDLEWLDGLADDDEGIYRVTDNSRI